MALARCMHRTNEVSECLQRAKATSKARLFQNYTSSEVNTMFSYTNSQKSRKISRTASSSAFSTSALAVVVTRRMLLRFASADLPAAAVAITTVDSTQWDQILKKVHFGIHVIFIF